MRQRPPIDMQRMIVLAAALAAGCAKQGPQDGVQQPIGPPANQITIDVSSYQVFHDRATRQPITAFPGSVGWLHGESPAIQHFDDTRSPPKAFPNVQFTTVRSSSMLEPAVAIATRARRTRRAT
jgi:hypothetical protein